MRALAVHTTVATPEQAQALARALVERRLAACVQIERIDSVYRWQGEVCAEPECRLLCKTTEARWPALLAALTELHPYELPAIHAVALERLAPAYAAWLAEACSDPA